jgi:hypothetical protein
MNMIGIHPSATSAVACTLLPMSDAHQIGTSARTGWLMSLSGLPRPVPCSGGSGICTVSPSNTSVSRRRTRRQTSMYSLILVIGFS